jgi:hypothetical protein
MNLKKNKIFIYFFVSVLFLSGIFCLRSFPILKKYMPKFDFINYKKTMDYIGHKCSLKFFEDNHNFYGFLNLFKLLDPYFNKKYMSVVAKNSQISESFIKDSHTKNFLCFKSLKMKYELKNSEYSAQTLNYMNQYPWSNISKIYKKNINKNISTNSQLNFLEFNNNISFS